MENYGELDVYRRSQTDFLMTPAERLDIDIEGTNSMVNFGDAIAND